MKVCWWYGLSKVDPMGAALSEGADPTARSSKARRISASIAEYGNLIKNSVLFMDTAIGGTKEQIMADLAKDAAETLDNVVRDVAVANGTVLFAAAATHRSDIVSASSATIKDIRRAVRLLRLSSVPTFPGNEYVGLCHPDIAYDLETDSDWKYLSQYRDTVKYDIEGEIGKIYGVRFKLAPTIPILQNSGSANVNVYRTLIFGPEYLGLSEIGNIKMVMNEPGRASELGTYNTYGYYFTASAACLSSQRAIRLESSSTLD